MKILRDLRLSTKMLILFELVKEPKMKLKPLSEKLEMTVQGVSEYLKLMEDENLIQHFPGEYKPTRKGIQQLHNNIVELRDFIVEAVDRLEIIQTCVAVARTKITKGQTVGLFMENGQLTAYADKKSTSTGIAVTKAGINDDILIKELEGIVELSQGKLVVVEIPSIDKKVNRLHKNLDKLFSKTKIDRIGALDTTGFVMIKKLGLKCDFEFASANAGIEASQKGLNVILLGNPDEVARFVNTVEEQNSKSTHKFKIEVLKAQ